MINQSINPSKFGTGCVMIGQWLVWEKHLGCEDFKPKVFYCSSMHSCSGYCSCLGLDPGYRVEIARLVLGEGYTACVQAHNLIPSLPTTPTRSLITATWDNTLTSCTAMRPAFHLADAFGHGCGFARAVDAGGYRLLVAVSDCV